MATSGKNRMAGLLAEEEEVEAEEKEKEEEVQRGITGGGGEDQLLWREREVL